MFIFNTHIKKLAETYNHLKIYNLKINHMKIAAFLFMVTMGVLSTPTLGQDTSLRTGKTFNNKILTSENQNKSDFTQWMVNNAHEIKTVDAENGFEDLQLFKVVLKDVNSRSGRSNTWY